MNTSPERFSPGTFANYLDASFSALQKEMPAVYLKTCGAMGNRRLCAALDGERVGLNFSRSEVTLEQPCGQDIQVELSTTGEVVLQLIEAKTNLIDAVQDGALWLSGDLQSLIAFHEGLMFYLAGAVRSFEFPKLLARFRRERFRSDL